MEGAERGNGVPRSVAWAIFRQAFWAVRWIVAAAVVSMFVVSGINAVQPLLTFPNDVVSNVVIGGMLAYGAVRIIDGMLTLGAMIAFMAYVPRAYSALRGVLQTYVGTHTIRNSFERLDTLFAAPREVDRSTAPVPRASGDIAFRDVSFSYGEGQALRGFTATFPAGHFIGLVGPSGGGKTTIFELMLRIREPDSGTITIGGTDAIDSVTEQIVLRSLRELSRGRTTIVIAHRLATVMEADTVLVLDAKGRLSQEGPPRELIKRDGFFRELFETQRLTE